MHGIDIDDEVDAWFVCVLLEGDGFDGFTGACGRGHRPTSAYLP